MGVFLKICFVILVLKTLVPQTRQFVVAILGLLLSVLSSAPFSMRELSRVLPSYFALLLYALSTNALETTWRHMESTLGKGLTYSATTGVAFLLSLFLYVLGRGSVCYELFI